jgi:iron complex outermembrane receptor protein
MRIMKRTASRLAIAAVIGLTSTVAVAQEAPAADAQATTRLDEIIITAQRREVGLQDSALAVSAISGATMAADQILSFEDVAKRVTSLSFTAISGLDQEFNIRGITNTRLDSPSADQSIGIFVDEVYVGRPGMFNFDLYDIERVEVVRGPQGVLLGRNVVGGAVSVITARPSFTPSGGASVSYGSYNEVLARAHVTGPITDSLAGRLSVQTRNHDGYNYDIEHNRELDNVQSFQARAQLLYAPDHTDLTARLVFDYTNDRSNGGHQVAWAGGAGPWSAAREAIGLARGRPLSIRESLPSHPHFRGDATETPQGLEREAFSVVANIEKGFGDFATLQATIGYRSGQADNVYDQTGVGPGNSFGVISPTLFTTPVAEYEDATQFSQELRLVSNNIGEGLDWIVGVYHQEDNVDKIDHFWGEIPMAALDQISGESLWDNSATSRSYSVFGQLGYTFNDQWRVVGGLRYSNDEKEGRVIGRAIATGDRFNPGGTVPLTPLAPTLSEGESFTANYSNSWSEVTAQATVEYTPTDDLLFYLTYSTGYKGGGFEDTPANAIAAAISYDPETVVNIEVGAKIDFLDGRARLNLAAFSMDYDDLQVTQTDTNCLCSVTDNAASARILGLEAEARFAVTNRLEVFGAFTYLDTEYLEFVDSLGNNNEGKFLQRTPRSQYNIGIDYTADLGDWADALNFRVNYTNKGKMYWAPTNQQVEDSYGLLDARVALALPNTDWQLAVWGRNLNDTLYRTNINYALGDEVSRIGAPRTYGVELAVRF